MFLSVRYFDDVPKGTQYCFDDVRSLSCVVDEQVDFRGDEMEVYQIVFEDSEGIHNLKRVLDFEVI